MGVGVESTVETRPCIASHTVRVEQQIVLRFELGARRCGLWEHMPIVRLRVVGKGRVSLERLLGSRQTTAPAATTREISHEMNIAHSIRRVCVRHHSSFGSGCVAIV